MSQALDFVCMTETKAPKGFLQRVPDNLALIANNTDLALDEETLLRAAILLGEETDSASPDYIFFRRFHDGRSAQVDAYVVDNHDNRFTKDHISKLHKNLWLSGKAPLLYVGYSERVDIYSCCAHAQKETSWAPKTIAQITEQIEDNRYSSWRLVDGTFWDINRKDFKGSRTANKALLEEVKNIDKELNGSNDSVARQLLLHTLLLKYLEDREVIPKNWFEQFQPESTSCRDIFRNGNVTATVKMFEALHSKFNGDIFFLDETQKSAITQKILKLLADLTQENLNSKTKQFCLWELYSFKHIPVEVLSQVYQYFTEGNKGAFYTPIQLVNLMLDKAMPLASLKGNETVLDPTCGSGIFLVSAFQRLVHVWKKNHNWNNPTPKDLQQILHESLFGIEMQKEAAQVTAFSLALALCDALQPNIIWEELRFKKIVGENIVAGSYEESIDGLKKKATNDKGFDYIVGNPPFIGASAILLKRIKGGMPDNSCAYAILADTFDVALTEKGTLCMVQPAGFLYNLGTNKFRQKIFTEFSVKEVLDFVSLDLFEGAQQKVVVVHGTKERPSVEHTLLHLTFRNIFSTENSSAFDVDYYDFHYIPLTVAQKFDSIWKTHLLGGGRLFRLLCRLEELPKLAKVIKDNGWIFQEGFIVGTKKIKADFIAGKPFLPSKALKFNGIDESMITTCDREYFDRPRTEELYTSPVILIRKIDTLPVALWNRGTLTYNHGIIGIHANLQELSKLEKLFCYLNENRVFFQAYILLKSSATIIGRQTSILKNDIDNLPCPKNDDLELVQWERELLGDILAMAEYVSKGSKSSLFENRNEDARKAYCETFLRLMRTSFPKMQEAGHGEADGLAYQAFSFGEAAPVLWLEEDWVKYFRTTIVQHQGDKNSLTCTRIVRFYEGETIIFIKPSLLRYWIRSVAIKDVDDVVLDIIQTDSSEGI